MRRLFLFFGLLLTVALSGAGPSFPTTSAAPLVFQTDMFGDQQVPPVDSAAWGFVRFFFDESRDAADYTVDVKGLSSTLILGADIHNGAPGSNGPVVHHLTDGGFLTTSGRLSFSAADLEALRAGQWYVSLKTSTNPEGELRGQIVLPEGFLPPPAPQFTRPSEAPAALAPYSFRITPPNTGDAGLAP